MMTMPTRICVAAIMNSPCWTRQYTNRIAARVNISNALPAPDPFAALSAGELGDAASAPSRLAPLLPSADDGLCLRTVLGTSRSLSHGMAAPGADAGGAERRGRGRRRRELLPSPWRRF